MRNPFRRRLIAPVPKRLGVGTHLEVETITWIHLECGHWTFVSFELAADNAIGQPFECHECWWRIDHPAEPIPLHV